MKNLGSGMDGILKMIVGILAICGVLIMVVTNVNLSGTDNNGSPAPESSSPTNMPGQMPGPPGTSPMAPPQAAPSPALPAPGTTAQSAAPAVPATPSSQSFSPTGRAFGDPMMDPSPIGLDGRPMGNQNISPNSEAPQTSGPSGPEPAPESQQPPMGPPPPAM
jgi:hypothetical protein